MINFTNTYCVNFKMLFILTGVVILFSYCDEVEEVIDENEVEEAKYGRTPAEFIDFLDNNGSDYYLDDFGNPYTQGELLVQFDNGFDQDYLDQVVEEVADINEIDVDDIVINQCPCGTEDLVLLEFEEKLDEITLEPRIGTMGDQDGDDDGLSTDASQNVTTSNNYYNVPLPQTLNNAGQMPSGFGPPDEMIGQGHANNGGDEKLRIAILDSGLDFDHPDLPSYENFSLWKGPIDDCYKLGYDFVNERDIAFDDHGHGTQVTGVILEALKPYDVPVAIMPLKISDENGSVDLFDMFCAMSYAVRNGADIVNISAGWYGAPNFIISELIETHPNTLFVCSSGNEGLNTNPFENHHFPSGFSIFENVISIAALDEDLDGIADYSNYGSGNVSMASPGTNIETLTPCDGQDCDERTIEVSGTSFASPYTVAVAAAILHCGMNEVDGIREDLFLLGIPHPDLIGKVSIGKYHNFDEIVAFEDCRR